MLENAYTQAPEIGVLGDFNPSTGSKINVTQNARHMTYRTRSLKCVHGFELVAINSDSSCFSMGRTTPNSCPFTLGISTHTWFIGPSRLSRSPANGISIGSAVFAGPKTVINRLKDRQTDRQTNRPCYSVCSNKPLSLAIVAMRPSSEVPIGLFV